MKHWKVNDKAGTCYDRRVQRSDGKCWGCKFLRENFVSTSSQTFWHCSSLALTSCSLKYTVALRLHTARCCKAFYKDKGAALQANMKYEDQTP